MSARDRARELVLQYGWNAAAYQILNAGMELWFSARGDAVVGYARHAHTRVVAGAPVCAEERLAEVVEELRTDARRSQDDVVYFGAGARLERLLDDRAHHLLRLGAQPVWAPGAWDAIVRRKASLRAQIHRARNKGVRIEAWRSDGSARQLEDVLQHWLHTRGLPPLHFMTETHLLDHLGDRRVFVARRSDAEVIGFLVATPIPARFGWLVEQWPRVPSAPNGTTHLLVDAAMRSFAEEDASFVTLGLAPLSDRAGPIAAAEPAWVSVLLRWLRAHGRRFYNFRGLDAFKASLQPQAWEPIYCIVPGPRVTVRSLRAIAGAFSGGSPIALLARALGSAVRREVTDRLIAT